MKISKMIAMTYKGQYGNYEIGMQQKWYNIDAVQWYTCEDRNNFYICIQGSRSDQDHGQDWWDNLDFPQTLLENHFDEGVHEKHTKHILDLLKKIEVHEGHNCQTKILFEAIYEEIKTTKKNIVIGGHSSGGGVAQILVVYIGYIFQKNIDIHITEGAPRSGNKAFIKAFHYFSKNNVRIVYRNDPVTRLPFRKTLFWVYRHVGNKLQLGKKRGWRLYLPCNYFKWIKKDVDHNPKDYTDSLEKYINENVIYRCRKKHKELTRYQCQECFINGESGYAKHEICRLMNLYED
ncbi:MAG: lipase family protein [Ignavibacteria bacterium]